MNPLDLAVIHDAKNNLSTLLLSLEKHGHFENEMQMILKTSGRLTNLLLWHKEQEGEMFLNVDAVSPADLIDELQQEYQAIFPDLEIKTMFAEAPVFWFYDATYIRLALENAVHNACSFAKNMITLSAELKDNQLVFSIKDDGKGFPNEVIQNFEQKKYAEESQRGTGLGMVLSNSIAQMHKNKGRQGYVTLRNDHGARFEMVLP